MKKYAPHSKKTFVTSFICLLILVSNLNLSARIFGNGAACGYCNPDDEGELARVFYSPCDSINNYIIEGAGYFLNSYSETLKLLNRIELSDQRSVDYYEVNQLADNIINDLRNALRIYEKLIKIAELTPYNEEILYKLETFDYKALMEKNNLNSDIFEDLQVYLQKGDITGTYKQIYTNLNSILRLMYIIKSEASILRIPSLQNAWRLNKEYTYTLLFGQYISEVFYSF